MILSREPIFNCFSTSLLIYAYKFIKFYGGDEISDSPSISFFWFSKVSFLIKSGLYDYRKYTIIYSNSKKNYLKSFLLFRLKILEISFCFLIISFCKFFPYKRLTEWV